MPYKFNEYVSTYVDPQSVKISETLRNRFVENFKANDELALAVDQMKAALPFENDVKRKNELQQQIDEKLSQLSERGDYENLGFAVHRTSKEFAEAYSPIKENYERHQAAIAAIDEQYKKGDINSEQYNLASSYITKGYKGYEMDPTTGKVKAGTLFTAPTIYKDPKIMDLMTKRLEILQMKKRGYEEGSVVADENGTYKRKVGAYTEEIPEADVMEVYNSVIKEPDVAAYLSQMADMKTNAANKSGQSQVMLTEEQAKIKDMYQTLGGKAAVETDEIKKAEYKTAMDALYQSNEKINAALKDPKLADEMIREYYQEELLRPVKEYAMKKAGLFTYKEESGITGGDGSGGSGSGTGGKADILVPFAKMDMVRADTDVSGADHKSKMAYLANTDQQIQAITKELADHPEYSDEIKGNLNTTLNALVNSKSRVTAQMKEAADSAVSMADLQSIDPKITGVVKAMFPSYTTGDIYTEIQRIFDNTGDQDYMNFQEAFDKQYGQGALTAYTSAYGDRGLNAPTDYRGAEINMAYDRPVTQYQRGTTNVAEVFREKLENKVNTKYSEIKRAEMVQMGLIETGMGKKTDIQTTKAAHAFFENRFVAPEEMVTVIDPEDGTAKQMNGGDPALQGFKIDKVGWIPKTNTWVLNLVQGEGEKAVVKTAYYDGSQIKNEGLNAVLNSPEVRFGSLVMEQKSSTPGVPRKLETVKINGKPVSINIYSRGDESPYISITNQDGTPYLAADKEKGAATKHNLDEPVIKSLINSGLVTGF